MKLMIARHGETEENRAGILQGHLPGTLTDKGIEQAKRLAQRLKDKKIDHIYSSDLARAADTAELIAQYHPNTPLDMIEELRERDAGELEGTDIADIDDDLIELPSAESTSELYERGKDFLEKIISKHGEDTVLLVCHGGIGKALYSAIQGTGPPELWSVHDLKNSSLSIVEIKKDGEHNILCFNDVAHLEDNE